MIGQNYNGLPNGRMIVACLACGFRHDLGKWGWKNVVCQACRKKIDHPIAGIKTSRTKGIKSSLMLSKTSRDLLYTISELQGCSQSEALNMVLKFGADEFRAASNTMMHNPKDKEHWASEIEKVALK